MKFFLFAVIVLVTCINYSAACNNVAWHYFKIKFDRHYNSLKEEQNRFEIFCVNMNIIHDHNERYNRGEETYEMGMNQFADMTIEEYHKFLGDLYQPNKHL